MRAPLDAGQGDRAAVPVPAGLGRERAPLRPRTPSRPTSSSASARTPTSWSPAPPSSIDRGVYPFVVPYRPIPGTLAFADGDPAPDPELLAEVTARVAEVLRGRRHARRRPGRRLRGLRRVLRRCPRRGAEVRVDASTRPRGPGLSARRRRSSAAGRAVRRPRRHASPRRRAIDAPPPRRRRPPRAAARGVRRRAGPLRDDAASDLDEHDARPARDRAASPATAPARSLGGVRLGPRRPRRVAPRPRLVDGQPPRRRPDGPPTGRRARGRRAGPGRVRPRRGRRRAAVRGRRSRPRNERLFAAPRLAAAPGHDGRAAARTCACAGRSGAFAALVAATKAPARRARRGAGRARASVGDDGAPVPGSDLVAACDAILPAMVERDPEWAGWCGVLVNVNDLAAMGAAPGRPARRRRRPRRVVRPPRPRRPARRRRRLRRAGARRAHPARGARLARRHRARAAPRPRARAAADGPGTEVRLTADLGGGWRPGLHRPPVGLHVARARPPSCARWSRAIGPDAPHRPAAAKDVSMAGRRRDARHARRGRRHRRGARRRGRARARSAPTVADWLTCFPGFALLTADAPGAPRPPAGPADERGVRGARDRRRPRRRPALARRRGHRGRRRRRHRTGQRPAQRRDHRDRDGRSPPRPPASAATWTRTSRTIASLLERARAAGADAARPARGRARGLPVVAARRS